MEIGVLVGSRQLGKTKIIPIKQALPTSYETIQDEINKQQIFFNDLDAKHWFFDFKINDLWISSVEINNELTKCTIEIY